MRMTHTIKTEDMTEIRTLELDADDMITIRLMETDRVKAWGLEHNKQNRDKTTQKKELSAQELIEQA